ncbi:GNAT family N-acetyltransferase [Methylobacillus gramineus]|uniref:GNAT family N-acetyltransferase n=1 Tax=Methylobacillus gramineus TaxID=755169 RepID=UPI001CFF889B|nr:GNAT family N-acetyltransferase [Methylobacillus gramineus]MCB5185034.1 GNAT family N-acetyltransferase [Methylobacillus gramineus]
MSDQIEIGASISELNPAEWDALGDGSPLLSHAFLSALEQTGCVGGETGWQPCPLLISRHGKLVGAVPLYLKSHSYGEYVFDWSWADAYAQHGLEYYPKLVAGIPFTPITGARLLTHDAAIRQQLTEQLVEYLFSLQVSSIHVLFPDDASASTLQQQGWIKRTGVQFRWENQQFASFDAFLMALAHDKRKKIRQERKKVTQAGVHCRQLVGAEITTKDWDFFYACYVNTYLQHRSTPYLTKEFFHALGQRLPEHVMLVLAELDGQPIGGALNLYDKECLYGRYWGALGYIPNLHFELCYYQAQEFCIAQGIRYFEGGAQGEHKLARGFSPRPTCSFHQLVHPDFEAAVRRFVIREEHGMMQYQQELDERAPYKKLDMGS